MKILIAIIAVVLTVSIVIAIRDQERIDAIGWAEPRTADFYFYEKVEYWRGGRMLWKRGDSEAWTIFDNIGPYDGYAISKGE
jgi:hypothetical protein